MAGPPARYGMVPTPPPSVGVSRARASFTDIGFLRRGVDETPVPAIAGPGWIYNGTPGLTPSLGNARDFKVPPQRGPQFSYSDPSELLGVALWRRQAIVSKTPQQFGTDGYALGHYAPFRLPRPTGTAPGCPPLLAEMQNSAYQPISRGGHVLVSLTEVMGRGPSATWRSFGNTTLGLWFKSYVIGGSNVRPLGSQQVPSPQFRGVMPNFRYMTTPSIIGA